ncbi:MAG: hypothetical protein A2Y17_04555 [Clostridiales bacterium GWF2_38_85]|nr:MAG: hypothetical protein A2Y17_04555 [Clostridiales bacterium GWF2_38_85]HBL85443.1 hypothetical protein [Clostridiales bacterium]
MRAKKLFSISISIIFVLLSTFNSFASIPNQNDSELLNDIPKVISFNDAIDNGHIKRMLELENSLSTIAYKNIDGTNTIYSFTAPIKYQGGK